MNNDLISRAALLSVIEGLWNVLNDPEARYALSHVNRFIEVAPAVDAEPVRHGRWVGIEYDGYADGCPVYDLWECSECGHEHSGEEDTLTDYCPNCGARMDGDKDGK